MKRAIGLALVAVALAACSGGSPVAMSPSPSAAANALTASSATSSGARVDAPSPAPMAGGPYFVVVDLLSLRGIYTVTAIDVLAHVGFLAHAEQRTAISTPAGHAVTLPYVSTTRSAIYFLNGDADVVRHGLDGTQGLVARLKVGAGMEAAFAVSPDDSTLAVSVLDFNTRPVEVTLYTQRLFDSATQVIFRSTSDYVWPVAWHGGLLVLAHAYGPYEEDIARAAPGRDNPYSAISYHLVDPVTAERKVLMGACTVSGPLSPAGSACIQGGTIDWRGNVSSWGTDNWGSISSAASLSPDGAKVAAVSPQDQTHLAFWSPDGTGVPYAAALGVRDWAGWNGDVVITGSYLDPGFQPEIVTLIDGNRRQAPARGFFAALLPTDIV